MRYTRFVLFATDSRPDGLPSVYTWFTVDDGLSLELFRSQFGMIYGTIKVINSFLYHIQMFLFSLSAHLSPFHSHGTTTDVLFSWTHRTRIWWSSIATSLGGLKWVERCKIYFMGSDNRYDTCLIMFPTCTKFHRYSCSTLFTESSPGHIESWIYCASR